VKALAAFLTDPETGGYNRDHVFTLTDAEAIQRNIRVYPRYETELHKTEIHRRVAEDAER